MSNYKGVLSPLNEIACKSRLKEYYITQKQIGNPVYYLLPSMKWLQEARKRQPGMAFKTFDDIADLILNKADVKYIKVSEAERDLFFQQLLSNWEDTESNKTHSSHRAKAYSQTYGQLMRLGLTLDDLPQGLQKLKPALEHYEQQWVRKKRLLDPENTFHEAINLNGVNLPIGQVVIDGYMDFSPLQYAMLRCLIKHQIPVTIYIPSIDESEIIAETLKNLRGLGFQITGDLIKSTKTPQVKVCKAVTKEEEIRGILSKVASEIQEGRKPEEIGIILTDESYRHELIRIAPQYLLQVEATQKAAVIDSNLYKTIAILLKQTSFSTKWEKIALIDQIYQLLFYPRELYWESKQEFLAKGSLPEDIEEKLNGCIAYRRSFKKSGALTQEIEGLLTFLESLNLTKVWKERILSEENTEIAKKIRVEWMVYETIVSLLTSKKATLEEQGLIDLTINLNIFSQWLHELVRKKEIYVERKPAKGLALYTFREAALFKGNSLYIMGMNEGVFPGIHRLAGYFQDSDLKEFPEILGAPSKATFRKKDEATFKQLFYLAHELHFSYICGFDPENELQPSPFIEEFCHNVEYLCAENRYKQWAISPSLSLEQAAFMMGIGKTVQGVPTELKDMENHLRFLAKGEEQVNKELTTYLVSNKVGVTTLESYASCPFRYGLERLLNIKEPTAKQETLNPLYTGSMLHNIIERFYTSLGVIGKTFSELTDQKRDSAENLLLEIFNHEWEYVEGQHTDLSTYDLELEKVRWANMLKKWWRAEQILYWDNDDLASMKLFKLEEHVEHQMPLENGGILTLIGKIDRVDLDDEGFVVYDYKSGKATLDFDTEVKTGLKLQIPLYISIMQNKLQMLRSKTGQTPEGGAFTAHGGSYVSLNSPKTRASNGVWRSEHVASKNKFKINTTHANKEETLDGEVFLSKYKLQDKIKELWENSSRNYSVKPLKCFDRCPYNGICRVTDELIEEGGISNGAES